MTRRALAGACAALFAGSALIQGNDPDPLRWMALYAAACALAAGVALERPPPAPLRWGLVALAGTWALALLPQVIAAAAFRGTEEERELAGLLLVTGAALGLPRRGSPPTGSGSVGPGAAGGPPPRGES